MNKNEFEKPMRTISGAYHDERYMSKDVLNTWYKYFKDFDVDVFSTVLDAWILKEPKSPAISDVHHKCEVEQKKADKKKEHDALEDYLGTPEDKAAHPFEDGWRIDDDDKWVQVRV